MESLTMEIIAYDRGHSMDFFCHVPNGTCRLTIYDTCPSVMFLSTLIVNEKCRKQGIGTAILEEVEKIAKESGCDVISLQVKHNSWMKDWYLRNGFIPVADGYNYNNVIMSKFVENIKGE